MEYRLELKPSPIAGNGIYADEPITKGALIGRTGDYVRDRYDPTQLGKFHNHSATPNCHSIKKKNSRYLIALNVIEQGDELTVDYTLQPELEQPMDDWSDANKSEG